MDSKFLERTNYFYRPTTWLKRTGLILLLSIQLLFWDFDPGYLRFFLIFLIASIILILRKKDLAVDHKYFYYLKTSIIPALSKTEKYEIDKIKSIRGKAYESWFWALYGKRSLSGLDFGVELTLSENESASLDINIYKKDMDRVLNRVRQLMNKKEPNNVEK